MCVYLYVCCICRHPGEVLIGKQSQCVCAHMWCAEARGWCSESSLASLYLIFLRQGLSLILELTNPPEPPVSGALGIWLSLPPQDWYYRRTPCLTFYVGSRNPNLGLCACRANTSQTGPSLQPPQKDTLGTVIFSGKAKVAPGNVLWRVTVLCFSSVW